MPSKSGSQQRRSCVSLLLQPGSRRHCLWRRNNSLPVGISALHAIWVPLGIKEAYIWSCGQVSTGQKSLCCRAHLAALTYQSYSVFCWATWLGKMARASRRRAKCQNVKLYRQRQRQRGLRYSVPCGVKRPWCSEPMSFLVLLLMKALISGESLCPRHSQVTVLWLWFGVELCHLLSMCGSPNSQDPRTWPHWEIEFLPVLWGKRKSCWIQ